MGDTVPDLSTDMKSEDDSNVEETAEAGQQEQPEDVGELACPKCGQIYAGPASLKRHLWRIHRLAGDDAQALVDEATENPLPDQEKEEDDENLDEGKSGEEEKPETSSPEVKPLLAVSLSSSAGPKIRPLLSLSPEPPMFQGPLDGGNSFGMQQNMGGGMGVPQTGLLPTPSAGPGMGSACHQSNFQDFPDFPDFPEPLQQQQMQPQQQMQKPNGDSADSGSSNKVQPLMSLGMGHSVDQGSCGGGGGGGNGGGGGGGNGGGGGGGGGGGIKPLMSIPVDFPPYMMSNSMGSGGGCYGGRYGRRRERRQKPYHQKGDKMMRDENMDGQEDNSCRDDNYDDLSAAAKEEDYLDNSGGQGYHHQTDSYNTVCGECGVMFDDPASLADHEPCSQSVSIDLNCDVEITG